jgi:DNA-binding LacI/PurR family transcriptional regulator
MVTGFDDVKLAGEAKPALTTIRQPCFDLATAAFHVLLERIGNPEMPPRQILLDAPLVVRKSTRKKGA